MNDNEQTMQQKLWDTVKVVRRNDVETVTDFIFLGSRMIVGGDCSHGIKRYLPFGRKAMRNLDSILKHRDISLLANPSSDSYGFSSSHVWMWQLDHKEGWVPKNWCSWSVVLDKTLESPLDSKIQQSILKEINSKYSLEGLMLKLKIQQFGHLMWKANSLEKTLMLGKTEGREKWAAQDEMVG